MEKKRGHIICPNCGKESFVVIRRGEAEIWCRKCRKYFRVVIEVESKGLEEERDGDKGVKE